MRICNIKWCNKKHDAKWYCSTHYARYKRNWFAETTIIQRQEHWLSNTSEYTLWLNIKSRCYNKNKKDYKHYWWRWIFLYEKWITDFKLFYDYIWPKPSSEHSLDRKENNKWYIPWNLRWVTHDIQANNQRIRKDNKSWVKWIFWNKNRDKWEVYHKWKRKWAFLKKEDAINIKNTLNLIVNEK